MSKIAIVTDSSCDLPNELVEKFNITVVPLRINFSHGEYRDGIDISSDEVADQLKTEVPKTSMPSPEDIEQTFIQLRDAGYTHCIALTISSNMSGTYNTFRIIAEDFEGMKVEVVDTKGLSWVLGLIVLEAARMIQDKFDFQDILNAMDEIKEKVKGFFVIDTLEYLREGGRIGRVTASLGTMLNLKPVITVAPDGRFVSYGMGRGKKQGVKKMLVPIMEQLESARSSIAIFHSKAEAEAEALKEKFKDLENVCDLYISSISPTLLVHAGPGILGIAISTFRKEDQ
ncbi:DegV family protein [Hazenella sp. IB182357]|uniref:DegV family protein n=1 Tax=Polycladospora coralii TaxID=2771432 RepID=A0A926RUW2_9BACL|nr:DegV family protein [Polycladospora coralii]MBD1373082.1 DegV family protein [Polycladospora coralii]MBS7529572.1 DegV family protein [Polycladospora coralii]